MKKKWLILFRDDSGHIARIILPKFHMSERDAEQWAIDNCGPNEFFVMYAMKPNQIEVRINY